MNDSVLTAVLYPSQPSGISAGPDDLSEAAGVGPEGLLAAIERPGNRELVSRAIALLARRESSRATLIAKLLKDGFARDECEAAARWCQAQGFLDEARHARGLAARLNQRYGSWRVAMQMRGKGVPEAEIETALETLKPTEVARARALLLRRYGESRATGEEKARQTRFLRQRGFAGDVIKAAFEREV